MIGSCFTSCEETAFTSSALPWHKTWSGPFCCLAAREEFVSVAVTGNSEGAAGKARLQAGPGVRYLWLPNSIRLPASSFGSCALRYPSFLSQASISCGQFGIIFLLQNMSRSQSIWETRAGLKSVITMFDGTWTGNERLPVEQRKQGGVKY